MVIIAHLIMPMYLHLTCILLREFLYFWNKILSEKENFPENHKQIFVRLCFSRYNFPFEPVEFPLLINTHARARINQCLASRSTIVISDSH